MAIQIHTHALGPHVKDETEIKLYMYANINSLISYSLM